MADVEGLLRIGDFGSATSLSIKALRHYDEVGLLEPHWVDPASGYRWYRPDQVRRAVAIRLLRELDVPLPEVAALLDADADGRRSLLDRHRARLQQRLDEASSQLARIATLFEEEPMLVTDTVLEPVHVVSRRVHCPAGVEQAVIATAFGELSAEHPGATSPLILVHGGDESGSDQEACLVVAEGTPGAWLLDGTTAGVVRHEGPLADSVTVTPQAIAVVVERHGGYRMPLRVTLVSLPPLWGEGDTPVTEYAIPYSD